MEKGEGSNYRLHRCGIRVQDTNSVWRKMARHGTELGRLLVLVASARGWAGSWSGQVQGQVEYGSKTDTKAGGPESETGCD